MTLKGSYILFALCPQSLAELMLNKYGWKEWMMVMWLLGIKVKKPKEINKRASLGSREVEMNWNCHFLSNGDP